MAGLQNGKMTGGRETERSSKANLFFRLLAGGSYYLDAIVGNISGGQSTVRLSEATGDKNIIERECIDYAVYNNLCDDTEET